MGSEKNVLIRRRENKMEIKLTSASHTLEQQHSGSADQYLELETAEEIFELAKRLNQKLIIYPYLEGAYGLITVYDDWIE